MNDPPAVGCVLLNWNGWRDTIACLRALSNLNYDKISIVVVDNGSTDGSVLKIREAFPDTLLLTTGANLGFAGGNNFGIKRVLDDGVKYVWLLNNDTIPDHDSLLRLVEKAESDSKFGAIGSSLMYAHEPEKVQAWGGGRINLWFGVSYHSDVPRDDAWFHYITAASVLLSRAALLDVGLLDDRFFLYWEDADLSYRMRRNGWRLGVAGNSRVLHKEHASTGRNRRLIDRYVITSGIRFLSKHAPVPWASVFLFLSSRLIRRMLSGEFSRVGDIAGGIRDYLYRGVR